MRVLQPSCAVRIDPDNRGRVPGENRGQRLRIAEPILLRHHGKELAHRSRGHGVRIEIAHDPTDRAVASRRGGGFWMIANDGRSPKPVKMAVADRTSRLSLATMNRFLNTMGHCVKREITDATHDWWTGRGAVVRCRPVECLLRKTFKLKRSRFQTRQDDDSSGTLPLWEVCLRVMLSGRFPAITVQGSRFEEVD